MENKTLSGIAFGIGIVLVLAIVFSFITPIEARDNPLIIQSGNGGSSSSGVTSLTSANSAITFNASSGHILLTPKWQLLAQNSTIVSSGGITTIVNQNLGTNSFIACGASDGTRGCAERTTSTSVLNGQTVNRMTVGLRKVSTPTGTANICVLDSSNNCLYTFGTQDVSLLTTSCTSNTYTGSGSWTISEGQWIGIKSPAMVSTQQLQACATTPNQFDTTNSFLAQFGGGGSWVNLTTWDLGSSILDGVWKLERVGNTYIESDFTAKKHILATAELRFNSSDTIVLRMNNDTGSNYAIRTIINNVLSSLVSKTHCDFTNSVIITSGDRVLLTMWIDNNQNGDRKIINGVFGYGADTNATTAPSHIDFTCKWDNTSTQINNILLIGNWLSGSILTVWGYD